MKIAFFDVEEWEKEGLFNGLKGHEVLLLEDSLDEKSVNFAKDFDVVSVFVDSKVNGMVLSKLERLKAIVTRSTGYDHIDLKYCKKRKIKVLNVPSYGENTVAEHAFALILSLSRKIHRSYERTVRGNFNLEGLTGFDLKGKTIGIIGLGKIGSHVARMAKGFEMKVVCFSKHKNPKIAKKFGVKFVSLQKLLKNSDIVTLHVPLVKETEHMISKKELKMMKSNALLINTARGGVIDTTALIKVLASGKLGGAGLDVLEEEDVIREERELLSKNFPREKMEKLLVNHLLLEFDNVLITPHNAFNSAEALQRILDTTVDNIKCVSKGGVCKNLVR
jgi:D-lactate dehydrogenase